MTCASCGTDNEPGRKFCHECGARLAVACPACGLPNTPGAKFCGECGAALAEPGDRPAATAAAAPATERRLVSVLFADLVGFTTLSESRDAEDVRELLGRYFETCREIIDRYGGTVEKFIGDAVMAVWGTPIAQEDDAERAVRAALDLVDAVRRLGAEAEVPEMALRAGVHTGEAVVTIGASGMGMVAGDLVNTASRLQSIAAPGTVLVGDGTHRSAGTAIVFEEAGEQTLKGKASPVAAYRALRVVAQRGGVGRNEGLEPPFVGRDAELRLIRDFYHATARERGPRLVSVIGQAGIGKSRLAWEFLKYIDGVTEVVYWHQGRSPAYGDGISFWALGEMVRMRIGIGETDDEAHTRERLTATLEEFVPDGDERRALEDPLLHLLGIGDARPRERGQLFVAWRTFFERIAEQAPVVMVFEDLQWADDGLLDFIEELVTWSRGRSIYLITLSRPELLDRRPAWGAGLRSFTSLALSPLGDDDMQALLDGLVPGLPSGVVDQIVRRAEGIPLYAVETVRTLLNDGRIRREGDTFRPSGELDELGMPESLLGLIAARIDALPPAERALVQDGAILGQTFQPAALRAVTRADPDAVEPMLAHLLQREILTIDDDPRSPERGSYRFVQGLVREVAYSTLSRDDRRARHLAAARYYEALGDDELAGVLAQHYVDAYQAHPDGPEGAAVAAQARVALRGAAQRSADLGSFRRALAYLESALRVATDPAEQLDLEVAARDAAGNAAIFDTAIAHAERVIELAAEIGNEEVRRRGVAQLGNILTEGQQERAHAVLTAEFEAMGGDPNVPGGLELTTILCKLEMRRGDPKRAIELADLALPIAATQEADRLAVDIVVTRAVALANIGRTIEAVTALTGALEYAGRRDWADETNRAAVNLGYVIQPDDPRGAFEVSKAWLDRSVRDGIIWSIRYLLGNAIDAAIEIGEWDWALAAMEEHGPMMVEQAEGLWFGTYENVTRLYRGEDRSAEVRELYESSRGFEDSQYRSLGAFGVVIDALLAGRHEDLMRIVDSVITEELAVNDGPIYGGRSAIWAGDLETARRMQTAFDHAPRGRRSDALRATLDAGIAALEGRADEARDRYRRVIEELRELGLELWLGMAELDVVVTGSMEPDERRRAADDARAIFTRLEAGALLERLDRAVAEDEARASGDGSGRALTTEPRRTARTGA